MKITQLRNATMVIHAGEHTILVDPMFAPKASIPSIKYLTTQRRRNPLVDMPEETEEILSQVTHCLITHCQKGHFDHLDRAGVRWLRENKIPVFCSSHDAAFLSKKGLEVHVLNPGQKNVFLNGSIDLIPCIHGEGIMGKFMEHGTGFVIQLPDEPSLYITGDTLLSNDVRHCISTHQPDYIVLPAGGARFDIGGDIIMGQEEALQAAEISRGHIIANHLEALDHCPVSRQSLRDQVKLRNWQKRFHIPNDGETLSLTG